MKKVLSIFAALLLMATAHAQNSAIDKAKLAMEAGKLAEAETTINEALQNPKTKDLARANMVAGDIQLRKLDVELQKAILKTPFDTLAFVNALDNFVVFYNKSHELDNQPDAKGKVKPKYGKTLESNLNRVLNYYMYAGQFLNTNGDFAGAYKAFDNHLKLPHSPIYSESKRDSILQANKDTYTDIVYYAAMLAYQQKNWDNVLKQTDVALRDTSHLRDLYLMKLTALLNKQDTAQWLATSQEAISRVPDNLTYAQNLLAYYNMKGDTAASVKMGNDLVEKYPNEAVAWFARGSIYLNMTQQYAKARADFGKAIELKPDFHEAEANMAIAYINEGATLGDKLPRNINNPKYKEGFEKVKEFYRKAKPHAERARELSPDTPREWAMALRNIYYNLEEKSKLDEITAVINSMTSGK